MKDNTPRTIDQYNNWHTLQDHGAYMPSPDEIAVKCAEIRATWTPARLDASTVVHNRPADVHVVSSAGRRRCEYLIRDPEDE